MRRACRPVLSLVVWMEADALAVWRAKSRQGSRLRFGFSALPVGQGSLRYSVSRPRRGTHCAHCVRYVQTVATSQSTKRAARAATSLPFLGVEQALRRLPCRAFARGGMPFGQAAHNQCREDGAGGRSGACAAPSTAVERGQSGAQRRTGEKSLWAGASSAGAGGIAAAPRSEERREPVAQRRALQRSRCAHPPRPCAHAANQFAGKQYIATPASGRQESFGLPPTSRRPDVPIWASPDRFAVRHILGKALCQTWAPLRTLFDKYRTERRTTLGSRRLIETHQCTTRRQGLWTRPIHHDQRAC